MMQWAWASVAALGIIAAAVISWNRDRGRFILARMAIEKGLGAVPGMPAPWIRSLRNALSILIVGIGLMIVGAAAWGLARWGSGHPEAGTILADAERRSPNPSTRPGPAPAPIPAPMPEQPPGPMIRPPLPHRGPGGDEMPPLPPHSERGPGGAEMPPPPPVVLSPAMERWHQAREREKQQTLGLECAAVGFVLALLGLVRVGVAKVESQYAEQSRSSSGGTQI